MSVLQQIIIHLHVSLYNNNKSGDFKGVNCKLSEKILAFGYVFEGYNSFR